MTDGPAYSRVDRVVRDRLCHRCGVCGGLCPAGAIEFDTDAYPAINDHCTDCGLCAKVCSGHKFDLDAAVLEKHGNSCESTPAGPCRICVHGNAVDPDVRLAGASGGVVTATLLHLLETGQIKGALLTRIGHDGVMPESFIATSPAEIRAASESRYCLFPWGMALRQLSETEGPVAIVGLACQVQSFHKAAAMLPDLADKVSFIIGIFCQMNIEPAGSRRLAELRGLAPSDIKGINFRDGAWPGSIAAVMKDGGNLCIMPARANRANQGVTFLKWTHGQRRCLMCSDIICTLADMSVGDPWIRDRKGRLLVEGTPGYSVTVCRSEAAERIVHEMQAAGRLEGEAGPVTSLIPTELRLVPIKRRTAAARASRLRSDERPYPRLGLVGVENASLRPAEIIKGRLFEWLHRPAVARMFLKMAFSKSAYPLIAMNAFRKRLTRRRKARVQPPLRGG